METESLVDDIQIIYGETTPRKFIEFGYKLKNLEQIIEEPTITGCSLWKNDKQVCFLYFYNIKEYVDINMLYDIPIDFVFLDTKPFKEKNFSLRQKVLFSIISHFFSALIIYIMYVYKILPVGEEDNMAGLAIFVVQVFIWTIIWEEDFMHKKGNFFKKVLVCFSLFLNLVITIIILYVINEVMLA